jgi:SAM-dependent methyltransferase
MARRNQSPRGQGPEPEADAAVPARIAHALPFSEACERNKGPILDVLRRWLGASPGIVLEIGSGTGQHAVHFARHLPQLTWQPTEQAAHLAALAARISAEGPCNLLPPLELDAARVPWPSDDDGVDAVFTANTFHIMPWPEVQAFFRGVARVLRHDGLLFVYGPFRYGGQYTSYSNQSFDAALRDRDPRSGIRDFEALDTLAVAAGLALLEDAAMPANNQTLVWRKVAR